MLSLSSNQHFLDSPTCWTASERIDSGTEPGYLLLQPMIPDEDNGTTPTVDESSL